jgi:hypothetical protein
MPAQTALQGGQQKHYRLLDRPVVAKPGHLEHEIEKTRRTLTIGPLRSPFTSSSNPRSGERFPSRYSSVWPSRRS